MKGFFVTGTDTGVGKTEVAAYLAKGFSEKSFRVGVMKPIATGVDNGISEDAQILKRSASSKAPMNYINPIALKLPLAPLIASRIEKKRIDMNIVWDRFKKMSKTNDIMIVEGIGGVMVPICEKGKKTFYVLDMILKMDLPVIIVARPNLGTINHTIMTIKALKSKDIKIEGIIFNHTAPIKKDISIETNPAIIRDISGVGILGTMYYNKNRGKRKVEFIDYEDQRKVSYNWNREPALI